MASAGEGHSRRQQAETLRRFNRCYTARLGLLQGVYLGSGFSLTEARVLYEVAHGRDVTAAALGTLLSLDAGYLSRLVASLGKRGLLRRKPSRTDGRAQLLQLTASGKRSAASLDRRSSRQMELLLETVPAAQRLVLAENLDRARQILSAATDALPAVTVTRATLAHARDARRLLNEYFREVGVLLRDTAQNIRRFLADADSGLWIAYLGDEPAGCVALRPLPQMSCSAECKRLYVRAAFRRRGIADALLDALEDSARRRSLSWIYLDSKDDLEAAIAR